MKVTFNKDGFPYINGKKAWRWDCDGKSGGRGSYWRTRDGKYIMKLGYVGNIQCKREAEVWDIVKDTPVAKYFAPVLASGTTDSNADNCNENLKQREWVVVEYIEGRHNEDTWNAFYDVEDEICKFVEPSDMHRGNVWTNSKTNQVVIIDYGYFKI